MGRLSAKLSDLIEMGMIGESDDCCSRRKPAKVTKPSHLSHIGCANDAIFWISGFVTCRWYCFVLPFPGNSAGFTCSFILRNRLNAYTAG